MISICFVLSFPSGCNSHSANVQGFMAVVVQDHLVGCSFSTPGLEVYRKPADLHRCSQGISKLVFTSTQKFEMWSQAIQGEVSHSNSMFNECVNCDYVHLYACSPCSWVQLRLKVWTVDASPFPPPPLHSVNVEWL